LSTGFPDAEGTPRPFVIVELPTGETGWRAFILALKAAT
jgi:hypothetical protein